MSSPSIFPPLFPRGCSSGPVDPQGWDRIVIGGLVLPGKARVLRGGASLRVDAKNAPGQNGARPTFHGLQPQQIEIAVTVWTQDQLERLYGIVAKLRPSAKATPAAVSIDAPAIRHLGITSVVVTSVSHLDHRGADGVSLTLGLLEWVPPRKPAKASAKSATVTPQRVVRNVRAEAAAKKSDNPMPSASKANFEP